MLRFLQTSMIQKVGSTRTESVDIRIICATNRSPEIEVKEGRFREDLYYRLSVIPIELPPLRARGHDITLLANAFLQRFGGDEGKVFNPISSELARALGQHNWPGNVRELQNFIRRAAVIDEGPDLSIEALSRIGASQIILDGQRAPSSQIQSEASIVAADTLSNLASVLQGLTLDELERIAIEAAISNHSGNLTAAAKQLGVSPSTLYRKRERWLAPPIFKQRNSG